MYLQNSLKSIPFCGRHLVANGKANPFYFNLPVIAWFILKGKAACCDEKLSFRYPLVEALTGALFVCSWLTNEPKVALIGMIFIAILITATFIDLDHMIIPDIFSIGGMLLGVTLSMFIPEFTDFHKVVWKLIGMHGLKQC